MRFCSKCGSNVNEAARFCTGCGNPMGGAGNRPHSKKTVGYGQSTNTEGQKKNRVIIIVAVLVFIVVAYVIFFDGGGRGIVGTWELTYISGITQAEFREEMRLAGGFMRIQFNSDNTGAWMYGTGERFNFVWSIQNGVLVTTELGRRPEEVPFTISRNRLTVHENGYVLIFRRR